MPDRRKHDRDPVMVIGLGRFGRAIATELERLGHEVLAVDRDRDTVQQVDDDKIVTHVVEADTTDAKVLRQIGATDIGRAVVAIGDDLEASILTVAALEELGVTDIWCKANTDAHGKILKRVGRITDEARIVQPEKEQAERVAHLVTGQLLDYFYFGEEFVIVETTPPTDIVGEPLLSSGVRERYRVNVLAAKRLGGEYRAATPSMVLASTDRVLVAGTVTDTEAFAETE